MSHDSKNCTVRQLCPSLPPSLSPGAGKTTLLNALAGQKPLASGKIILNSKKMSKKMKRKISYVQQADIFFPNLTLRETLRVSVCMRHSILPGNQDANWDTY